MIIGMWFNRASANLIFKCSLLVWGQRALHDRNVVMAARE